MLGPAFGGPRQILPAIGQLAQLRAPQPFPAVGDESAAVRFVKEPRGVLAEHPDQGGFPAVMDQGGKESLQQGSANTFVAMVEIDVEGVDFPAKGKIGVCVSMHL